MKINHYQRPERFRSDSEIKTRRLLTVSAFCFLVWLLPTALLADAISFPIAIDEHDPYSFCDAAGRYFFYKGVSAYYLLADELWDNDPERDEWKQVIDFYHDHGFNTLRIFMMKYDHWFGAMTINPWATQPGSHELWWHEFDENGAASYWTRLQTLMAYLRDEANMEAELCMFDSSVIVSMPRDEGRLFLYHPYWSSPPAQLNYCNDVRHPDVAAAGTNRLAALLGKIIEQLPPHEFPNYYLEIGNQMADVWFDQSRLRWPEADDAHDCGSRTDPWLDMRDWIRHVALYVNEGLLGNTLPRLLITNSCGCAGYENDCYSVYACALHEGRCWMWTADLPELTHFECDSARSGAWEVSMRDYARYYRSSRINKPLIDNEPNKFCAGTPPACPCDGEYFYQPEYTRYSSWFTFLGGANRLYHSYYAYNCNLAQLQNCDLPSIQQLQGFFGYFAALDCRAYEPDDGERIAASPVDGTDGVSYTQMLCLIPNDAIRPKYLAYLWDKEERLSADSRLCLAGLAPGVYHVCWRDPLDPTLILGEGERRLGGGGNDVSCSIPIPAPTSGERQVDRLLEMNRLGDTTLGYRLSCNRQCYSAGDEFTLTATITNAESEAVELDEYLVLVVAESYYFWHGDQPWASDVHSESRSAAAGASEPEIILDFVWPEGAGDASGLLFEGALLKPGSTSLDDLYAITDCEFSYS